MNDLTRITKEDLDGRDRDKDLAIVADAIIEHLELIHRVNERVWGLPTKRFFQNADWQVDLIERVFAPPEAEEDWLIKVRSFHHAMYLLRKYVASLYMEAGNYIKEQWEFFRTFQLLGEQMQFLSEALDDVRTNTESDEEVTPAPKKNNHTPEEDKDSPTTPPISMKDNIRRSILLAQQDAVGEMSVLAYNLLKEVAVSNKWVLLPQELKDAAFEILVPLGNAINLDASTAADKLIEKLPIGMWTHIMPI